MPKPSISDSIGAPRAMPYPRPLQRATMWTCGIAIATQHARPATTKRACIAAGDSVVTAGGPAAQEQRERQHGDAAEQADAGPRRAPAERVDSALHRRRQNQRDTSAISGPQATERPSAPTSTPCARANCHGVVERPPTAKPSIVRVEGSAAARSTPNSACTADSTTTTDHMPTHPTVPSAVAAASRRQARPESAIRPQPFRRRSDSARAASFTRERRRRHRARSSGRSSDNPVARRPMRPAGGLRRRLRGGRRQRVASNAAPCRTDQVPT
jgi:hypothetical protein